MKTDTLEAVRKHGETLLAAFPNATEKDPVQLCRKLRRIETAIARVVVDYSNGTNGVNQDKLDHEKQMALIRCGTLLGLDRYGIKVAGLFVNLDPRGNALKLDNDDESGWFYCWQKERVKAGLPEMHHDWGGYGIIAPDLSEVES